jgi:hypothetical protein
VLAGVAAKPGSGDAGVDPDSDDDTPSMEGAGDVAMTVP